MRKRILLGKKWKEEDENERELYLEGDLETGIIDKIKYKGYAKDFQNKDK